ncbi:MAG: carbon monoxide dehydrogenase [Rhizobiaceae bacterium]|nr:carbon monoxide dehydrogenase [Rhizobiaceae bacterium]
MEMKGTHLIQASRETVWAALNDPDVLRVCIPGCKELEKKSETELAATVVTKVGPVKATFKGEVTLKNLNPPNSYSIVGEGKGGIAGFAKGGANVRLSDADGGTQLDYDVDAKVGGKLAALGSRLIDSTAKKLAGEFFTKFSKHVGGS